MTNPRLQHYILTAERITACRADPVYEARLIALYRRTLRTLIGDEALVALEASVETTGAGQ